MTSACIDPLIFIIRQLSSFYFWTVLDLVAQQRGLTSTIITRTGLIVPKYQPICWQNFQVLDSQSDFGQVVYEHYWEFPINKKIIPMWTCPVWIDFIVGKTMRESLFMARFEVEQQLLVWALVNSLNWECHYTVGDFKCFCTTTIPQISDFDRELSLEGSVLMLAPLSSLSWTFGILENIPDSLTSESWRVRNQITRIDSLTVFFLIFNVRFTCIIIEQMQ